MSEDKILKDLELQGFEIEDLKETRDKTGSIVRYVEINHFGEATHWLAGEDESASEYDGVIAGNFYPLIYDDREEEYHIIDEDGAQSLIYLVHNGKDVVLF